MYLAQHMAQGKRLHLCYVGFCFSVHNSPTRWALAPYSQMGKLRLREVHKLLQAHTQQGSQFPVLLFYAL